MSHHLLIGEQCTEIENNVKSSSEHSVSSLYQFLDVNNT